MAEVDIKPVQTRADLAAFIDLPWMVYAEEPNWAPPLRSEVRHLLDPHTHPFWKTAQRELFLAFRKGRPVGRIAAIIDHNYNSFHNERMGIWGFFECANDKPAAQGLFAAAADWVRERGMTFLRGPLNPSTNYEIGLLIEGFQYPPVIMIPYNPPFYAELVEHCGLTKEKDLLSFRIGEHDFPAERTQRLANAIIKRNSITIRCADREHYDSEMALIKEIYNASWQRSWGFVPMSDAEIDETGRTMLQFVDLDLVFFVYRGAHPAGVVLVLPDINPILKLLNGRIGPLGILKVLLFGRRKRAWRGTVFGFKEEYRKLGLPLVAFDYVNRILREPRKRSTFLDLSWNLEDNHDINQFSRDVGGKVYKRHRIYRKEL